MNSLKQPKIVCIVGPTASGKTDFAIDLALKENGEVVSCDSMQIYRYMNITADYRFSDIKCTSIYIHINIPYLLFF